MAAHRFDHAPHLAIASLCDRQLQKGLRFRIAKANGLGRPRRPVFQNHAFAQLPHGVFRQNRRAFHQISLRHMMIRIGQPLRQLSVVGQDQQSAGVQIQPSDGRDELADIAQQIVNRRTALRIFVSSQITLRLVEQQIGSVRGLQRCAVQ